LGEELAVPKHSHRSLVQGFLRWLQQLKEIGAVLSIRDEWVVLELAA
jgi:hypothetical protein